MLLITLPASANGMGKPYVHQRPQHHIEQDNDINIDDLRQAQIEKDKKRGYKKYADHSRTMAHA